MNLGSRAAMQRFFVRFCLSALMGLVMVLGISPLQSSVQAQLISLPKMVPMPISGVVQQGNLDIGKVRLDGNVLFSIAAPATAPSSDPNTLSPIERRVNSINYHLEKIISDNFDPQTLNIAPSVLNNQTVLVASDKNWGPLYLLTVTPADLELGDPTNTENLAQKWSDIIQQALLQANQERQFTYQKRQIPLIVALIMAIALASLGVRQCQIWRRSQRRRLETERDALLNAREESQTDEDLPSELQETFVGRKGTTWYNRYLPQISIESQIEALLMLRPVLVALQLSLWLWGIGWGFHRFPQTRNFGDWLWRFPFVYISISLGIWLSKLLIDSICRLILTRIVDIIQEKGVTHSRIKLRALTIFSVIKQFNVCLILVLGFLLFSYFINALYFALIVLAGLAFLVQNVLQDFVKTFFILSEDQYALGDVIQIGSVSGTVEHISLRNSQIRTMSGDLLIFSHSSFNQITNFTHNQSGVKLLIDVAYSTDLDMAMTVIQEVAQSMQQDEHWGKYDIRGDLKGVDNFGDNSITLCFVLKTQLGQQWLVAREFRRRLKAAFDRYGISMPFPQRSIWFENALPQERQN